MARNHATDRPAPTTTARFLRPAEAAAYLGISRPTAYRWEREGRLPPRLRLGPGVSGWRREDLDRLLDALPLATAATSGAA